MVENTLRTNPTSSDRTVLPCDTLHIYHTWFGSPVAIVQQVHVCIAGLKFRQTREVLELGLYGDF